MEKESLSAQCPVDYAFQRIGGKYKGRILWLLSRGTIRYGEMRRYLVNVSPKMLTQALRELERDELICRKVYQEVPPRVEYSLSASGSLLVPFITQLNDWACELMDKNQIPAFRPRK
ncbi:winged helix-turn-helix transcriptional regulator [Paradesertivirga mongoliensis]|uniref:Winged helix-turn-helix transcriptional regulator n=1 Tax=Paradesertivirga mongoliensis TaxID=2100740 RepID=A0ABW4ZQD9_9SPHI|nr:helix-turn-helix domain-containing protein [Pedobacter mongoliensis]